MIRKYHNHKPQTTPWHCSVFPQRNKKNGTVCFCTTVPFFAPLFRFFHNGTKNGTVCFCTTVPFFALLFRFSTTEHKTEQCVFVPLFRFLHHCSDFCKNSEYDQEISQSQTADNPMALFLFCTTVPFFHNGTKKRNSVFLYHCSVFCTTVPFFPQRNKNRNNVFLYHCSVFCTSVPFFHNRTKTERCVFVPLFRFLYYSK